MISGTLKVECLVSGVVCASVGGLVYGLSLGCVRDGRSPDPHALPGTLTPGIVTKYQA